jgi:hypothetical protein
VKGENADIKEEEEKVDNCNKDGSEEIVYSPKKISIKEVVGEEENQNTEGSHVKKEDKLDKTTVEGKSFKESSSKKPIHSFFGNYSNYQHIYPFTYLSRLV